VHLGRDIGIIGGMYKKNDVLRIIVEAYFHFINRGRTFVDSLNILIDTTEEDIGMFFSELFNSVESSGDFGVNRGHCS
jgi:hypothetical protein